MDKLEVYRSKFAEGGQQVFDYSLRTTLRDNKKHISTEHVLDALFRVENDLIDAVMRDLALDRHTVSALIVERMNSVLPYKGKGVRLSPDAIDLFKRALARARSTGREKIEASDILVALSQDEKGLLHELLSKLRVSSAAALRAIRIHTGQRGEEHLIVEKRMVRIKSGAYASFTGRVEEVYQDRSKLKVSVNVPGRPVVIELALHDVEELTYAWEGL